MLGTATDQLSLKLGQTLSGLLNASFGNAVEIIVGIAALLQGSRSSHLFRLRLHSSVVQASFVSFRPQSVSSTSVSVSPILRRATVAWFHSVQHSACPRMFLLGRYVTSPTLLPFALPLARVLLSHTVGRRWYRLLRVQFPGDCCASVSVTRLTMHCL